MGKPVLMYFDFNFWKAEAARMAFFLGGVDFEDKRITREEQQAMKEKGELPFGQVPLLFVDGKWVSQGTAIIRYAGKKSGLYPKDDFEAAKVDEVLNLLEEIQGKIVPSMHEQDEAKKMEMRKGLANDTIPTFFSWIERLLKENNKVFLVGNSVTIADLAVWRVVDWITSGKLDGIPTTIADKYEKLQGMRSAVDALPKVAEWKKKFPQVYSS